MSLQTRQWLVDHPSTFFQAESQKSDLLDPNMTQTSLIALLCDLVSAGHILEFTAVRSDHHDDSALGEHCHAHGYCADLWPLASKTAGDYLNPQDVRMESFLRTAAQNTWLYQIGLAGSADIPENRAAAGPTVFSDDGADHVHLGSE